MSDPVENAQRAVEAVARQSYGRLIALLGVRTRDVAAAEDALSDALLSALTAWPRDGVPEKPEAWLLIAARRRLIDEGRRSRIRSEAQPAVELLLEEWSEQGASVDLPDERLKLLFVCAHPAIDPDLHTPLMLQTVLGLDAAKIARAFLVAPAAMSQRLVRAKSKIRDAAISFEIPEAAELPARLDAVLGAIYAAFGSGWEDATGSEPQVRDLAAEAIWLARVLEARLPEEPEVRGLLAMMLYCEARRRARRSERGHFVPLSEQDPALWNRALIDDAEARLRSLSATPRFGRFQLEAAIQSAHCERARSGSTDWRAVAWFHERLVEVSPTVGALVARAAAVAELEGAEPALALLGAIDGARAEAYQPYWAVRAHLLMRLGRTAEAGAAFDRAIELSADEAVKDFLRDLRG